MAELRRAAALICGSAAVLTLRNHRLSSLTTAHLAAYRNMCTDMGSTQQFQKPTSNCLHVDVHSFLLPYNMIGSSDLHEAF